jgi:DNA-binding transcriptional ArsR family regulator
LPQAEYLANVVLARVRRLTSKPHFAVRILAALQRFVPPPWQPWLTWELSLCSPRPPNRGEANGFWSGARAWWFREQDRRIVDAAFRPESCRSGDSEEARAIDAWRRGTLADAPFGVIALAPQDPPAWVLAMGRGPGRRTIDPPAGVVVLPPLRAERWRSDALLAELALGGDWLRDEDLFAAVWGFAFVYELHFNTFNLAVHRARERLGTNGSIERDAGSSRLVVQAPLLVPDPRCRLPIDHELLELLAREPISARSAAEALGIPLRTVQAALRELVDAGVCARRKDGRDIVYRVEDTTFCEPTHA